MSGGGSGARRETRRKGERDHPLEKGMMPKAPPALTYFLVVETSTLKDKRDTCLPSPIPSPPISSSGVLDLQIVCSVLWWPLGLVGGDWCGARRPGVCPSLTLRTWTMQWRLLSAFWKNEGADPVLHRPFPPWLAVAGVSSSCWGFLFRSACLFWVRPRGSTSPTSQAEACVRVEVLVNI